ncbi:MAG: hypothetical protein WBE06_12375, partial [Phycisphaerae bacterium]
MPDRKYRYEREDVAKEEVGRTDIGRPARWLLVMAFVALIAAVPALQHLSEVRAYLAGRRDSPLPQAYDMLHGPARAWDAAREEKRGLAYEFYTANAVLLREINAYEDALEDQSVLGHALRPPAQLFLASWLGAGNEEAYCGRGGWLFYRPGIDYVSGPGFLEAGQMARRAAGGSEWQAAPQPDPRRAILDFHRQLSARGIRLVVMPTPVKPVVHPEKFSSRYAACREPVQNASYAAFLRDLREAGVLVFDCSDALVAAKLQTGRLQYLSDDTHWRPEVVERVAAELASFVREHVDLPPVPAPAYRFDRAPVENLGDVARMLELPAWQRAYPPERAGIRQVLSPERGPWRAAPSADVLFLGDSFSNVYSLEPMGWGESAGLVEQTSAALARPLDRIVRNDSGAYATRDILARDLARGRDRLAGKRVVVWQFASRELAVGDWRLIEMTLGRPAPGGVFVPAPGPAAVVRATVEAASTVPRPGTVPYKDHILALHLVDLEDENGPMKDAQAVVYMWSMRDNAWTGAARCRAGDQVTVRLRPWSEMELSLDGINRSELSDPDLALEEPCWGEPVEGLPAARAALSLRTLAADLWPAAV